MVNMLCYVMTLTQTSKESWTPVSGRCNAPCFRVYSQFLAQLLLQHNVFSDRSACANCDVGEQCGVLMHGRAVTFCEPFGERELVTAMFNHIETTALFTAHWPSTQSRHLAATTTTTMKYTMLALASIKCHFNISIIITCTNLERGMDVKMSVFDQALKHPRGSF